jgi:hypothetical protein
MSPLPVARNLGMPGRASKRKIARSG